MTAEGCHNFGIYAFVDTVDLPLGRCPWPLGNYTTHTQEYKQEALLNYLVGTIM